MRTSFFLPMMFIATLINAENNLMSVEEAVKKKLIKVHIYGKGGHCGEVIKMKIMNIQNFPVAYSVEAGRRLDSKDSTRQDILVTKSTTVKLLANETKVFDISGMCCQAHNHSPDSGSVFRVGAMADSGLVKLAKFIDQNKWYNNYTAQSAVWIVSDNNPMEDIGGADDVSRKL